MSRAAEALLGACLIDQQAYWRTCDIVTADDFASGQHRRLWTLLAEMIRDGDATDFLTIGERDNALGNLALDLASTTPTAANARTYGELVARDGLQRRVIAAGQAIASLRGDNVLGEAQRLLAACQPRNAAAMQPLRKVVKDAFTALTERYNRKEAISGMATGLAWLDEKTGGLQPQDLIVLAARPSVGKTALGLQWATKAALAKVNVAFFSAEMSAEQIANRQIAHLSHVSLSALRSPKLIHEHGWTSINNVIPGLRECPMWIDDSPGQSAESISGRARQLDEQNKLGLIVVDYLGKLRHPKADRHDISVGMTVHALKDLAKVLNVPVVLLCQLNRDGANKRPTLTNLRESGDIEQDADLVMLMHRPVDTNRGRLELLLEKQRNGETGECDLGFEGARMHFTCHGEIERAETTTNGRGLD